MLKAYKFRLYPNRTQEKLIKKTIGSCRFVYNYSLSKKIETYQSNNTSLSQFDLNKLLPKLKGQYEWLKEVNSQSLQQENNHLDCAFKKFFKEKKGFPNFKSKIVSENQAIAIETLNIKGMLRNHNLAQAISDVSWSEFFRQLKYKSEWYGKTLLQIGQFEPSSKICSSCGSIKDSLNLNERNWTR